MLFLVVSIVLFLIQLYYVAYGVCNVICKNGQNGACLEMYIFE